MIILLVTHDNGVALGVLRALGSAVFLHLGLLSQASPKQEGKQGRNCLWKV